MSPLHLGFKDLSTLWTSKDAGWRRLDGQIERGRGEEQCDRAWRAAELVCLVLCAACCLLGDVRRQCSEDLTQACRCSTVRAWRGPRVGRLTRMRRSCCARGRAYCCPPAGSSRPRPRPGTGQHAAVLCAPVQAEPLLPAPRVYNLVDVAAVPAVTAAPLWLAVITAPIRPRSWAPQPHGCTAAVLLVAMNSTTRQYQQLSLHRQSGADGSAGSALLQKYCQLEL